MENTPTARDMVMDMHPKIKRNTLNGEEKREERGERKEERRREERGEEKRGERKEVNENARAGDGRMNRKKINGD